MWLVSCAVDTVWPNGNPGMSDHQSFPPLSLPEHCRNHESLYSGYSRRSCNHNPKGNPKESLLRGSSEVARKKIQNKKMIRQKENICCLVYIHTVCSYSLAHSHSLQPICNYDNFRVLSTFGHDYI